MPGRPRKCRFCEEPLKWDGTKWKPVDGLHKPCPDQVSHKPDNALRPGQIKGQ